MPAGPYQLEPLGGLLQAAQGYAGASDGAQQARCPSCSIPLGWASPHVDGCQWLMDQANLMANYTPNYGDRICNAYQSAVAVDPPAINIEPPKFFQF